jgi:hypothetical protein
MVIGHFLASGNKVEEVSNLIGLWMKRKRRCCQDESKNAFGDCND